MFRDPIKKNLNVRWRRMKTVCEKASDPRYPKYGGRGIKILWNDYKSFTKDMRPSFEKHLKKHGLLNTTLERIDNSGHYSKANCTWVTRRQQAQNRTSRKEITYKGRTQSVTEWAEEIGIPKVAFWLRLFRRNWSIEKAIETPLSRR